MLLHSISHFVENRLDKILVFHNTVDDVLEYNGD